MMLFYGILAILFLPGFLHAVCPLCIGIAAGGSVFSRFLPGGKAYMLSGFWTGFFLFATVKYFFEKLALWVLAEKDRRVAVLKRILVLVIFILLYIFLIFLLYLLNARVFRLSWFFSYHAGFFVPMAAYEMYHFLRVRGVRLKYGNVLLPMMVAIVVSVLLYFV